jgi:Zn-finger protein
MCEDYPCCGHELGDCPRIDKQGREHWRCVECGIELKLNTTSSICPKCLARFRRTGEWMNPRENDEY